ncbi:HAMP domain-containing sensor histidine kinase [Burkholderia sp. AU45274]|uniref:sensor histidine kinase n=1 Tax=Burkholderia sp. AU45274 TaxID=3059205 RepID=UPI002650A85D|nr:HAMP domain-containing sensor histidine kinase [Burkholderia sp. AU45274]MDN7486160.1 HAMP domain-containing sensor histidine kinase [Burkholderia sp. AU45274]
MFHHWIRRLSTRLWITNVVAFAISLALLAALAVYALDRYPAFLGRRQQMEIVGHVVTGLSFDDAGRPVAVQLDGRPALMFRLLPTEVKYRVLDSTGRLLLASTPSNGGRPWLTEDLAKAAGKVVPATIDGNVYAVATRRMSKGGVDYYVQVAQSRQLMDALVVSKIEPIPKTVGYVLLIATIIFGLTLPLTISHVLKPLREVSRAASGIEPHNLKTRLSSDGIPSEIKPLIDAFNDALTRLENGFAVQQRFLADAAHELQTPLTLVRGQIELQPDIRHKALLLREIDLMARQVKQLLHLAEVSEAQNFSFDDVNSVEVARDAVGLLAGKADAKQVKLHIEARDSAAPVRADGGALFILLKNILENAINASPTAGVVVLTVLDAAIHVDDEGPGIQREHVPLLFDRYWRAPESRYDGAGLGLAICKEIAVAHQWKLTVDVLATGTRFSVWF